MMPRTVFGIATLAACATVQAQGTGVSFEASAGLVHRRLAEHTADGGTLLTERGWLGQVRGQATRGLPGGGALTGAVSLAGAPIDYDGRTQAGAPLPPRRGRPNWPQTCCGGPLRRAHGARPG
ncbi:hypothetical protein ACPWT1_05300 [Ramlibacter sp. MMS24-I3-19]|uniref:hypothetical protein n=1 Tax=Ramlibacter sp. MMS24-I3-19 TaxID=3416606 RepID=UPI003CFF93BC